MFKALGVLAIAALVVSCGSSTSNTPLPWDSTSFTAFGQNPETLPLAGKCSLEGINGVAPATALTAIRKGLSPVGAMAQTGKAIIFNGWVGDAQGQTPSQALLALQGSGASYAVKLVAGGARPDVAEVIGSDGLKTSGYVLKTALDGVAPGDYRLWLITGGADFARACKIFGSLRVTGG